MRAVKVVSSDSSVATGTYANFSPQFEIEIIIKIKGIEFYPKVDCQEFSIVFDARGPGAIFPGELRENSLVQRLFALEFHLPGSADPHFSHW